MLERETLKDLLAEQDLSASGRVAKETAVPIGEIEGAELLVTGTVTEFEPGSAGIGAAIGSITGTWQEALAGIILSSIKISHVAIDIRLIDTTTSRILLAVSVEGKATYFNLAGALRGSKMGGGLGGYSKTPVEKAIRVALGKAVDFIVSQLPAEYYHYSDTVSP